MKKHSRIIKSVASIAAAAVMTASMAGMAASANTFISGSNNSGYTTANSTSNGKYTIPQQLYMTQYTSSYEARLMKAQAVINSAKGLLATVDANTLGLPQPSFDAVILSFGATRYDYLIKANAENNATVLTFNSQQNLTSAMSKIKTEEQTLMNNALAPFVSYINTIIQNGAYTTVQNGDSDAVKAAKLSNAAILNAVKNTLSYTYTDTDLFSGDVTGKTKTYQIAYLSTAQIGTGSTTTVVSNDEEFTNFPRLIINGQIASWDSVRHLNIMGNSNDSWWFALKDGNTLNNDYYWLAGMMIPDFLDTISFDAYANTYWAQYGAVANNNNNNNGSAFNNNNNNSNVTGGYYYNSSYNYSDGYACAVTYNDGAVVWYPNNAYAKAATQANSGAYISNVKNASYNNSTPCFCYVNGNYYASISASPYPEYTAAVNNSSNNTINSNYYISGNYVYGNNGNSMGTLQQRGYNTNATWFCTTDGLFYTSPQSNRSGYYYNGTNNTNGNYYISGNYVYGRNGVSLGTIQQRGYNTNATWFSTTDGLFYTAPQANLSGYYMNGNNYGYSTVNYYINNGFVYDINGNSMGTLQQRGYTGQNAWFSMSTGTFYTSAQVNMSGYYVNGNTANPYGLSTNDPYYTYWNQRLYDLYNTNTTASYKPTTTAQQTTSTTKTSAEIIEAPVSTTTTATTTTSTPKTTATTTTVTTEANTEKVTEVVAADNASYIISGSNLANARAKNTTIKIKPAKGVYFYVKGEDVNSATSINMRFTSGTKNIPTALTAAVSKNVNKTYSFTVGENVKWPASASLKIKFNKKNANFIAKLYRYDTNKGMLVLVNTATVSSNGYVTFNNIDHGGDYFLTLS